MLGVRFLSRADMVRARIDDFLAPLIASGVLIDAGILAVAIPGSAEDEALR